MLHKNYSLKGLNTFRINIAAKEFAEFSQVNDLAELTATPQKLLILGGGSNLLFTKDFNGRVLKNNLKGIELVSEDADHVYIKAGAGESWHKLVMYCIHHNFAGMENLALIPGYVGASPMQNIGAYGVEVKQVFSALEAFHIKDQALVKFNEGDCGFGYRESVFKNKYKDQFVILNVTYRLKKIPVFNISYGAISIELEKMNVSALTIAAIAEAVIRIRSNKLPDPSVIGNAGSFFKNPEVSADKYNSLKKAYPNIVGYTLSNGDVKLAAGWLIEQTGWKGQRIGDAGSHKDQALVLVNLGNATGSEIFKLSERIVVDVKQKFDVILEREVNIY